MKRLLAAILVLLACAPTRTVTVGGREVPYEQAARDEFAKAKAALDQGNYELAVKQFGASCTAIPTAGWWTRRCSAARRPSPRAASCARPRRSFSNSSRSGPPRR